MYRLGCWVVLLLCLLKVAEAQVLDQCCLNACGIAQTENECHKIDPVTVCGQAAGELCYCRWDVIIADEPERCFSDQHPEKTEINMPMLAGATIPALAVILCLVCAYKRANPTREPSLESINGKKRKDFDLSALAEEGRNQPEKTLELEKVETGGQTVVKTQVEAKFEYTSEFPQPQESHIEKKAKRRRSSLFNLGGGVISAMRRVSSFGRTSSNGEIHTKPAPVVLKIRT